jgi:hypothetical protein
MPADVRLEQHDRLLHYFANQVQRRLYGAGARSVQTEDIFQELVVAWCQARDAWKADYNVPFVAFLKRGMMQHINRWVNKELQQVYLAPLSLDETQFEEQPLHDVIADPRQVAVDEIVIAQDLREFVHDKMRQPGMGNFLRVERTPGKFHSGLSPLTLKFIQIYENPPQEIMDMLRGYRARQRFAKVLGVHPSPVPSGVTGTLIMNFLGATHTELTIINKELSALAEKINQE